MLIKDHESMISLAKFLVNLVILCNQLIFAVLTNAQINPHKAMVQVQSGSRESNCRQTVVPHL